MSEVQVGYAIPYLFCTHNTCVMFLNYHVKFTWKDLLSSVFPPTEIQCCKFYLENILGYMIIWIFYQ